jgi:ABC-type protease/lipase transport system fused ATPase/permease subunit
MQVTESKVLFVYQPCPLRSWFWGIWNQVFPVHPAVVSGLAAVDDEEDAMFALAVVARTWCRETVLACPAWLVVAALATAGMTAIPTAAGARPIAPTI